MRHRVALIAALGLSVILGGTAFGGVLYNNLTPNTMIAIATRPDVGSFEIEAGDDFVATSQVSITSAAFVGLEVPGSAGAPSVQDVVVEILSCLSKRFQCWSDLRASNFFNSRSTHARQFSFRRGFCQSRQCRGRPVDVYHVGREFDFYRSQQHTTWWHTPVSEPGYRWQRIPYRPGS